MRPATREASSVQQLQGCRHPDPLPCLTRLPCCDACILRLVRARRPASLAALPLLPTYSLARYSRRTPARKGGPHSAPSLILSPDPTRGSTASPARSPLYCELPLNRRNGAQIARKAHIIPGNARAASDAFTASCTTRRPTTPSSCLATPSCSATAFTASTSEVLSWASKFTTGPRRSTSSARSWEPRCSSTVYRPPAPSKSAPNRSTTSS